MEGFVSLVWKAYVSVWEFLKNYFVREILFKVLFALRKIFGLQKKSVNAKPFLVRTTFCTHQNFCKGYETSKNPLTSFGGCKNFVRPENLLFLDIHPSLGHQISQHMDYEGNDAVWLPAILIELDRSA